jgi:hypothetical protein
MRRRGFSLLEVTASVLLLAVAVPPTLELLTAAGAERADSVQTTRASLFAALLAESIVADAASTSMGLGFDAFEDAAVYLENPDGGLRTRLGAISEPFTAAGMTWTVEIGPATEPDGYISPNAELNVVREVTIRVRFSSATGDDRTMPLVLVVGRVS